MRQTPPGKPATTDIMLNRRGLLLAALALPVMAAHAEAEGDAPSPPAPVGGEALPLAKTGPTSEAIRALPMERIDTGRETVGYVAAIRGPLRG
jgi:hypothetical protein